MIHAVPTPQSCSWRLEHSDVFNVERIAGVAVSADALRGARLSESVCDVEEAGWKPIELAGTGQLARCLQHETDHLNGMDFGDRLSSRCRRDLYESHRRVADRYPSDWPVTTDVRP